MVLALNYIHGVKKIVHRDLTPANIVLGQGPEGLRHTKVRRQGWWWWWCGPAGCTCADRRTSHRPRVYRHTLPLLSASAPYRTLSLHISCFMLGMLK